MLIGIIDSIAFDFNDNIIIYILHTLKQNGHDIKTVKNHILFNQKLLYFFDNKKRAKHFNPSLYKVLIIVISKAGLYYKITKHTRQKTYTLTIQGLKQYSFWDESILEDAKNFINLIGMDKLKITRIDIAFDNNSPFNISSVAKNLKRKVRQYGGTTYLKTDKELRTNRRCNIKYYKKQTSIYRLEFSFLREALIKLSNFDEVRQMCEKNIAKAFAKHFKFKIEDCVFSYVNAQNTKKRH